ncbi:hypothetical protein [Streptomyces sp. NRRL S-37]|uniref:hypothetical protein n=1 Tax=Streptomyces sp. NRRL S-37 TaxID=1463903 RepID=UPI0004C4E447|nr:hypothetical protein [Streptomyces sp. NRRL S-37]
MADLPAEGLSVYRLLPGLSDYRVLSLDSFDARRLMRWQRTGAEADRPARLRAAWMGERHWPKSDFPSGRPSAPVFSRRVLDRFGDGLLASGSLVPVDIEGAKGDEYHLLLVEEVVDCLDLRRSSKPKKRDGEVKRAVFRADALPAGLPAFRLPQFPRAVQWNGWAVERLTGLTGDGIEARLLWSGDPAAVPHPDPWGI